MEEKRRKGYRNGLWAVVFLAVLAALVFFLYHTGFFASVRSLDDMREYIARFSPYSYGVYFLVQLLSVVAAPIPSNVTSLAGAAGFWHAGGFLAHLCCRGIGVLAGVSADPQVGRPFAERFVSRGNMDKYRDMIERKQDVFFAMAFLLPGFPDDILCFLAGLTTMPLKRFFLLVLLCRPWGLLVSCAVGGNALALPTWLLVLLCAAGAALFLIAMKYGDRWESALLKKLKK